MIKLINTCSPHSSDFACTGKLTALMRILEVEEFVVIKGENSQEVDKAGSKLGIVNSWAVRHSKSLRCGDPS